MLAPGEKATIWVITEQVQSGIPNGKIVRTHFEQEMEDGEAKQKKAEGIIELEITRRGAFFGRTIRSNSSTFYSTLELPDE